MNLGTLIAESIGFTKVFFGTTENLNFLLLHLKSCTKKKVLTIAGSGDSVISFLLQRAVVTGVDISPATIYWTRAKIAFANGLTPDDYSNLMNALNPNQQNSYDFQRACNSVSQMNLWEDFPDLVRINNFFSSPEMLNNFRQKFFYTTRNYRKELSPHSFINPGKVSTENLTFIEGNIFEQMTSRFDHIHLSNVLDYIFCKNSKILYDNDGTQNVMPNYSAMPSFFDCPEKQERVELLRNVADSLKAGGTASTFTAAYFSHYQPMFISCGQEAGFRVECHELPSSHLKRLNDFYLIFHKD